MSMFTPGAGETVGCENTLGPSLEPDFARRQGVRSRSIWYVKMDRSLAEGRVAPGLMRVSRSVLNGLWR